LEELRATLKQEMDGVLADGGEDEKLLQLVRKWNQVTAKRDAVLHRKVEQRALLQKYRGMLNLLDVLKGQKASASAGSSAEFTIRCGVKGLLKQVESFCMVNNVTEEVCLQLEANIRKYTNIPKPTVVAAPTVAAFVPPPPPPMPTDGPMTAAAPPPPPPMPNMGMPAMPNFANARRSQLSQIKAIGGNKSVQFRSPLAAKSLNTPIRNSNGNMGNDVLSQISKGHMYGLRKIFYQFCARGCT
jgi:hypothetical protein